jgi:hypothetical protein
MVRFLAVGLFALALGCSRARSAEDACRLFPAPGREPDYLDLTDALPFRNYLALTHVGPYAHHYFVFFERDDESRDPRFASGIPMISAWHDQTGALKLEGGGDLVRDERSLPSQAPDITGAVEQEIRRRCPGADFSLRYAGAFRTIKTMSFLPVDVRAGKVRMGWLSERELLADGGLAVTLPSHHRGDVVTDRELGWIRVPNGGRLVELDLADTRGRDLRFFTPAHTELVLAAAADHAAGRPAPRLADLPVEEPDSLIRARHDDKVHLVVTFNFDAKSGSRQAQAVLPLRVSEAVFGPEASIGSEVTTLTARYKVQAQLVPTPPLSPTSERVEREYRGRLTVWILDADGAAFERTFVASGNVIVKGTEAAVPYEWTIPGNRSPSPEYDLRHGKLRSRSGVGSSFSIDLELKAHPPR